MSNWKGRGEGRRGGGRGEGRRGEGRRRRWERGGEGRGGEEEEVGEERGGEEVGGGRERRSKLDRNVIQMFPIASNLRKINGNSVARGGQAVEHCKMTWAEGGGEGRGGGGGGGRGRGGGGGRAGESHKEILDHLAVHLYMYM